MGNEQGDDSESSWQIDLAICGPWLLCCCCNCERKVVEVYAAATCERMGESESDEGIENDGREFVLTITVHVEKAATGGHMVGGNLVRMVVHAVIAQEPLRSQEMIAMLTSVVSAGPSGTPSPPVVTVWLQMMEIVSL